MRQSKSQLTEVDLKSEAKLLELADYKPTFSPFRVLAVDSRERSYSAALRFCLDPQEAHGWGDCFLKMFVNACFSGISKRVSEQAFSSARVQTEWKGLDVLVELGDNGPVIGIEVKLWAGEGWNQIERYQKTLRSVFGERSCPMVFLTLNGRDPTSAGQEADCVPISWGRVSGLLAECVASSPEVQLFITNFTRTIMSMTEGDPDERRIVKEIFQDPALGKAILKAATIRYDLFSKQVLERLIGRMEQELNEPVFEMLENCVGSRKKEYRVKFASTSDGHSAIVFLFYDFPDESDYGSGMHVLIDGNRAGLDANAFRNAFDPANANDGLLSRLEGWGGNWLLALPKRDYPCPARGWTIGFDSFDEKWQERASECFTEALERIPDSLLPSSLRHV